MGLFRKRAGAAALATAITALTCFGSLSVQADSGAGGYTWEATSGYQEATDSVSDSGNTTTVTFTNADDGSTNAAGFCTTLGGEDWSSYTTLSMAVKNNGSSAVTVITAINTGAEWDWHQSGGTTIDAGATAEITYYLTAEEWTFGESTCAVGNLHAVQRINMMLTAPWGTSSVSGSVTISNMELGGSGNTVVEPKDGFYVDGSVLRDANQNAFEMRGTNYAYTWYKWEGNEDATLKEIAGYGANTVRIVLTDGIAYGSAANTAGEVANLISICEKYNLVCVLEVHDATGKDDTDSLYTAAKYFASIASTLTGHEDTVIVNIANEWQGSTNDSAWQSAYIEAVKIIRDAGLTHCIMCDAGGWGQGYSTVVNGGAAVLAADPEKNCMFSVHMYGTAGGSESTIKSIIDSMIARQLCLCIGEFGFTHSDGDVQEGYIMEYAEQQSIGWLSWSWYGNGSPVEYLDMSSANVGGTLSDWGKDVIYGTNGWQNTAEICTVYSGVTTSATTTTTTTTTTNTTTTTTTTTTNTTTTTTTTVSVNISDTVKGDVDCDGLVKVNDVILLNRFLSEDKEVSISAQGLANADMNGNGEPGSDDATLILMTMAGLLDA